MCSQHLESQQTFSVSKIRTAKPSPILLNRRKRVHNCFQGYMFWGCFMNICSCSTEILILCSLLGRTHHKPGHLGWELLCQIMALMTPRINPQMLWQREWKLTLESCPHHGPNKSFCIRSCKSNQSSYVLSGGSSSG